MTTLQSYFNKISQKKYTSLGFVKNKATYIRLTRDVLQAFTLKLSTHAQLCTVDFGIFPTCLPQPIFLQAGGYSLAHFNVPYSEWSFDTTSEESIMLCVESVIAAIDLHILPLFEVCRDCQSALPELIKLEELFECNRIQTLYIKGGYDSAVPLHERSLFDDRKYYMALKGKDFSYIRQYLSHQINFYKEKLKEFDIPNYPRQPNIVRERFLGNLTEYSTHLSRLNSGEYGYFANMLNSNERQMSEFLITHYPKVFINTD